LRSVNPLPLRARARRLAPLTVRSSSVPGRASRTRPRAFSRKSHRLDLHMGDDGWRRPACHTRDVRLSLHQSMSAEDMMTRNQTPFELVRCPLCASEVRADRLAHHTSKRCVARPDAPPPQKAVSPKKILHNLRGMQRAARTEGKKWVDFPCMECGSTMHVHVDWTDPTGVCRECHTRNRAQRNEARWDEKVSSTLSTWQQVAGHEVPGGLPSLGKRR